MAEAKSLEPRGYRAVLVSFRLERGPQDSDVPDVSSRQLAVRHSVGPARASFSKRHIGAPVATRNARRAHASTKTSNAGGGSFCSAGCDDRCPMCATDFSF